MKFYVVILLFLLISSETFHKKSWTMNTNDCYKTKVGFYNSLEVSYAKDCFKQKRKNKACSSINVFTSIDEKWARFEIDFLKSYNAEIIGGSANLLRVRSNKNDEDELRQLICDYWKNIHPLPRFQRPA